MLGPQNTELIALKKEAILSTLELKSSSSIFFKYHDIPIEFSSPDKALLHSIQQTLPASWFLKASEVQNVYKVSHYPLETLGLQEEVFEDEADSECYIEHLDKRELAYHRDFVALKDNGHVKAIFTSRVDDGFYNFIRWLLSRDLLVAQKVVLHSSVILGRDQKAYVFLGPSGAGKTTTCHNAQERLVLGDDMNILKLDNNKVLAQAGAIGGKFSPQVPIEQSYEVAGLYWLSQSQKLELTPLNASKAAQVLLVSLANMFWPSAREQDKRLAMDFVTQVIARTNCYELKLQNNDAFWKLIEPKK
tara:strand:+ start:68488 stop:69399 length:912 start_codon:yes stop_codon:yes gene_type:complete